MDEPFTDLNRFVKLIGLASTGGQAKLLIRSGAVKVNGEVETRNRKKLLAHDVVEVQGKKYVVGETIKLRSPSV